MPMPENCSCCRFAYGDCVEGVLTLSCMTPTGRKMYDPDLINRKSRPEWCPLKEQDSELSYREAKAITHMATKLDDATCPSCGNVVGEKLSFGRKKVFIQWKYCIYCGQKLDWESR